MLTQEHEGPGPRTIQERDLVVVYESFNAMKFVYVDAKATYSNRYGNFPQKDWIGRPFGVRVRCKPPKQGWVYLLAPTAELWSLVLRHRTQILYLADISMVCTYLDLRPGSIVLESGTGSGSLTHSLARAVSPGGHVHTFEFHQQRSEVAAAEFARHGLTTVTVQLRNIEEDGFPAALHGRADGVFLDLPAPQKVVPSAAACLRPDGRFCSFSPCIEQVQRTCIELDKHGFTDIITYEILLRNYEVVEEALVTDSAASMHTHKQQRREQHQHKQQQKQQRGKGSNKRQREEEAPSSTGAVPTDSTAAANKAASTAAAEAAPAAEGTDAAEEASAAEAMDTDNTAATAEDGDVPSSSEPQMQNDSAAEPSSDAPTASARPPVSMVLVRPSMDARGHTGYLTFARKFVGADAVVEAAEPRAPGTVS